MSSDSAAPPAPPGQDYAPSRVNLFLRRIASLLLCVELGLVLLLLPWTLLWDNNYFFSLQPQYGEFWLSNRLRGAVSGLGLVNFWLGYLEVRRIFRRKHA